MKHLVTEEEYDTALKDNKLVVVDFYAQWCGPCKLLAPKLEELATDNPSVAFFKVDVDDNTEVSDREGISAMPTIRYYRMGGTFAEVQGCHFDKIRRTLIAMQMLEV
jgi:thioredoxin 1